MALESSSLPSFSSIKPEQVEPLMTRLLNENRQGIQEILRQEHFTWENLILPLQDLDNRLQEAWAPIRHLNCVKSNEALRRAHDACSEQIAQYATELGQNETLYQAYLSLKESPLYATYTPAQKRLIELNLLDFKLSGVALPPEKKQRFKDIQQELTRLQSTFENHLMDATDAWSYHVTDEKELKGISDHGKEAAHQLALQKGLSGWLFNLEQPSYITIMTEADSGSLRETFYRAYCTRASELGQHDKSWDNTPLMKSILQLRLEEAQLLGFKNFSELSLAPKMAKNTEEVFSFLHELAKRSTDFARREYETLNDFAKEHLNLDSLNPWDVPYASEKLQKHLYEISNEALRPYFPEQAALKGLFQVVHRLFGLQIEEVESPDVWHDTVKLYNVYDEHHELRGRVYMDLYARPSKRGGAWMDQCHSRYKKSDGSVNVPIAFLTCNFSGPTKKAPALFTHDEVITLFHEFGHVLQGILTLVDYSDMAGTNHVAWDAVEFPSQFLENWCWDEEALQFLSSHYQTQEPLPKKLYENMLASKNFHSALALVRQLEFGLFDFRLHTEFNPTEDNQVASILQEVRDEVAAYTVPDFNRFPHSFSHIFAGGYAAGYYSYKWAEVLSADGFSAFEEKGIFDKPTGRAFLHCILETGGSVDPAEAFRKFRGREPRLDALLKHLGLV